MSLSYTIRESLSGFSRARLSTLISVATVSISLLFLGMFTIATIHTSRFIELLRGKVELEAFLEEGLSAKETARIQKTVEATEGVGHVQYVSKDEAAEIFQAEFGENIMDILEYNPLPASFKLTLREGYATSAGARGLADGLDSLDGIESVRYRKELLELIDTRAASINNLTLGIGIIISLSAIFLVSNTIRLAIHAKRHMIRTMALVGATRRFIRLPFLLEGILQGFLGGIVASGLLYAIMEYALRLVSMDLTDIIHREPYFYLAVLACGAVLGMIGGIIAVFRFMGDTHAS